MALTRSQSGKRKQEQEKEQERMMQGVVDGEVCSKRRRHSTPSDNGGVNVLPDDVLIHILSRLSLKEAGRASVLSRRWRFLWMFAYGTLHFVDTDRPVMEREKLECCWANAVVELHQARYIERTAICFGAGGGKCEPSAVDGWVDFGMQKGLERFELDLSFDGDEFPSIKRLMSHSHSHRLRTLRLYRVDVTDNVVHCFLASCPNLEELRIRCSQLTLNLTIIDPPRLRVLEIYRCLKMQSLKISAAVNLVSLTYGGGSLKLRKLPNLRDLSISQDVCVSLFTKPEDHRRYSARLEKLVLDFLLLDSRRSISASLALPRLCSLKRLEVRAVPLADTCNLSFLPTLLKACPQLCEFRVEMFHQTMTTIMVPGRFPFSIKPTAEMKATAEKCVGGRIKVVEIAGYIGRLTDDKLVLGLLKCGGRSIQRVVIDTQSAYFDDPLLDLYRDGLQSAQRAARHRVDVGAATQNEAIERAKTLVSKFPRRIKSVVT